MGFDQIWAPELRIILFRAFLRTKIHQKSMKKWKFFKINFFAHWKVYNNDIKHCEQSQKCLRRSIDRAQNYRHFWTEVMFYVKACNTICDMNFRKFSVLLLPLKSCSSKIKRSYEKIKYTTIIYCS